MAANSKATAAASATAVFTIKCGNLTGTLYTERFGPAGKSVCIKLTENSNKKLTASPPSSPISKERENTISASEWLSPIEFEKLAGKGAQHNWKRTVRSVTHDNKTMYYLLEQGILKQCEDKHCDCSPCSLLNMKKGPAPSTPIPKDEKQHDTDSDSGISVEISSINAPSTPVIREPLTTKEQEALLPNYTAMVQEAILALTSGAITDQGCSVLGIFLYILNHYPMTEPVSMMNIKIRSTLIMLKRVGIVENVGEDDTDDNELEAIANEMKIDKFEYASFSTIVATTSDKTGSSNKKEINAAAGNGAKIQMVKNNPENQPKNNNNKPKIKPKEVKSIKNNANTEQQISKKTGNVKKNSSNTASANTSPVAKKISSKKIKNNTNLGKENSSNNKVNKVKVPFDFKSQKQKRLSPALAVICGKKQMGNNEALKTLWVYIKKHKLQDPNQKTVIICDEKLKAVTKKKKVMCKEIMTYLQKHMIAIK